MGSIVTATRRRTKALTITVEQPAHLPRSARLYGPVRVIAPAIRQTGAPSMYDGRLHCFLVPRDSRLHDVMAALESAGCEVRVTL